MARKSFLIPFEAGLLGVILISLLLMPAGAGASKLTFRISVPREKVIVQRNEGRMEISVDQKGFFPLSDENTPALPVTTLNVLLPQGETFERFDFSANDPAVIVQDEQLALNPPSIGEDGVQGKGTTLFAAAEGGSAFPSIPVKYLGTGSLHGFSIASFAVSPLQYENGEVRLSEDITLNVHTIPSSEPIVAASRKRFSEGFREETHRILASIVANPEDADAYDFDQVAVPKTRGGFQPSSIPSLEGSPVEYLIITSNALAAEFQRLADWKIKQGVPAVVRTVEWIEQNSRHGVDLAETIRFFIQDAYEQWGIKWLLLGGDTDIIPTRVAYSRFYNNGTLVPTDLYYACLDGSWNDTHDKYWGEGFYYVAMDNPDLYAEVYAGRITTSKASDVADVIDKIISYATPYNRDYLNKVLMLSEVLFPVDWEPGQTINVNGADYSEYIYNSTMAGKPLDVTRSYETWEIYPGSVPETRQATIDSMNAGMGVVKHIGHGFRFNLSVGDGSVLNSDADALTNTDRYFLLYMLNCTAAAYDYYSLGEHFLRNPSGGAVSIIGASRSAFPNASSYYMNEFFDLLYNKNVVHVGETFTRSRLPRTPSATSGDNIDLWTHFIYVILSDPELSIWNGPVDTLAVSHVASVGLGKNTIQVTVGAGGSPVDSAFVCLYKGADDYMYGSTDALGVATFDFTCEKTGSVSVVVTGRNHARHQSYITVDPSADPYVNYASLIVDDDQVNGTFGNNNASIDAGETVEIKLSLTNSGTAAASGVSCIMRTSHPSVTIEDSTCSFGTIQPGQTIMALDPVKVVFPASITDETAIEFRLVITNSSLVWNDSFRRLIHAPELELLTLRIDDSAPLGNGDGYVDANEQFKLYCKLKNYGTGKATGLQASLTDLSGAFIFYDSNDNFPDLPIMTAGENTGGFHLLETSIGSEHLIKLTVTDMFGNTYLDTLEFRPPIPPTALVFNASLGVDRIQVSWSKSITTDVRNYNIYHSLTQGGPYELRSSDPARHAVYMDDGLSPSTKYYYIVTAIDKSGNESFPSVEYAASTNPPQLEGWPIAMADWTASSPAVGDIDGDWDLEVVQGNKRLLAWHHDGVELKDGDGDPQSWGVLNLLGQDYVAPVALAELDAVAGLDIIAISWATFEVYCFTYQGAVLPGWPRTTETNARCAPVIADLDGDGDWEIVVVDQAGVIYAWHADGAEYRDGDGNPATNGVWKRLPAILGWHYQAPAVVDIDHDDMDELVVGSVIDSVWVFNGDGTRVPGWPVKISGPLAGSIAVGDADLDGEYEILVAAKTSSEVRLYNHDGTICAGWPRYIASNLTYNPSVALADVTGDAHLEAVMASSNKRLYVITYQGADVAGWPVYYSTTTYTESSPVVADITGDGSPDIVLGDEAKYINAYHANGVLIDGFPIAVTDAVRGTPAVCDLDGDGETELICASWDKSLYVWALEGAYDEDRAPWPMFHANSHRNGLAGFRVPTAVRDVSAPVVQAKLLQNYPNPFNPRTMIVFYVPEGAAQNVSLRIYDVRGALMKTLAEGPHTPGRYEYPWDGRNNAGDSVASGVYFYRLREAGFTATKKLVLIK